MNVFVTGVTGYIGGSVALRLLQAGHKVRGLVRDTARFAGLTSLGIEPVQGTLDDRELLIDEAKSADAVINAASSDHREAVEAFITALRGSEKPFLHTSGSSLIGDAAAGNELSERIFDEFTPLAIAPEKQSRYEIDCLVRNAEGLKGIVLCNSLIYGDGKGLQPHSVQIPALVQQAQVNGRVPIVGRGLNRWSTVHIDDMCELYLLALEKSPGNAFYFVENGEESFWNIAHAIGQRLGISAIECLSEEQAIAYWGINKARFSLGSNSRVRAIAARQILGWKPKHTSVVSWIREDMIV